MELLRAAWVEYERDRARYLAAAMIYYALVSLVPLLLLLLAALGLLLRFSEIAAAAEHQMLGVIEARFGPELPATIRAALDTLQRESIAATAISLAGLFFTASVLFRHLRMSFRAIWKYEPPLVSGSVRAVVRATALEQALALAMVLGGGGLLLAALALIGLTQWLGSALPLLARTGWVLTAVSSSILAAIAFAAMFKVLPPVPIGWRDVRLAAVLCAVTWVAAGELLALYGLIVDDSGAYGALGGVLAAMLWMNIVSQTLFFGAELCKVVARRRS
jgi:membrane protein